MTTQIVAGAPPVCPLGGSGYDGLRMVLGVGTFGKDDALVKDAVAGLRARLEVGERVPALDRVALRARTRRRRDGSALAAHWHVSGVTECWRLAQWSDRW